MQKAKRLLLSPQAREDIQQAIDYYNGCQQGLGKRFHSEVKKAFVIIQRSPAFQIRYDDVHCYPLRAFPYLVHYIHDEKVSLSGESSTPPGNRKNIGRNDAGVHRNHLLPHSSLFCTICFILLYIKISNMDVPNLTGVIKNSTFVPNIY